MYRYVRIILTIESDVLDSRAAIVDLQWYLASILRLLKDLDHGLDALDYLSLDYCCKRDTR